MYDPFFFNGTDFFDHVIGHKPLDINNSLILEINNSSNM